MGTDGAMEAGSANAEGVIPDIAESVGKPTAGWFVRLVGYYLRRRYGSGHVRDGHVARAGTQAERAQRVIRVACVKSALAGAAAGGLSTGATVLTAETEGLAAIVTVPAAAVAIGGEMIYRALVHLDMVCDLADIFEVGIHPDDPADLWRIYALAFHAEQHANDEDPGKGLVERVVDVESHEVGESIGSKLVGESVLRNVVPFIGIAFSSVGNWRLTRRLGDTVRRYYRYQRALNDEFERSEHACHAQLDLLVEGIWFIFTADGQLSPEEAAVLAALLRKLDPAERKAVMSRFTEDEYDWAERIRALPEGMRDAFLRALNVAAAVDKSVSLPEKKILRRAARKLGREYDERLTEQMMREFSETGVLAQ